MTDLSPPLPITLSATGTLNLGSPSVIPPLVGTGSFVISGILVNPLGPNGLRHVAKYVGERNIPGSISRQRRYTFEMLHRLGQPVIVKRMLTTFDVQTGFAREADGFDPVYGQVRNKEAISHGVGYVSIENATDEYIDPNTGQIFQSNSNPGPDYPNAPKYRGYGPGYLTYIIEPDVADDFYKHTPEGVFIRVQQATAVAPWFPDINDNDLLINVVLDERGVPIASNERYQAHMTNPVSIRGKDRRGRAEYSGDSGNRYVINQTFQMSLIPANNAVYSVEIDR